MNANLKISICGGGALGHALIGYLSNKGHQINLLTGRPQKWDKQISVTLPNQTEITGKLSVVSSDPKDVIPGSDYVILCLPGYLVKEYLSLINSHLSPNTIVGSVVSSNGFFWMAHTILDGGNPYFGFQRVPFIARVKNYGTNSTIKGLKDKLKAYISDKSLHTQIKRFIETSFDTELEILDSVWPAALTNSNPLLHTSRLYSLFKDYQTGETFKEPPLFYEEWDDYSSELLINCDKEFNKVISKLPISQDKIPSILDHYEVHDAPSLTHKLRSIQAFKGIKLNMKKTKDGYVPDWTDRYFIEDIPYGLLIIKGFADYFNISTPHIDMILKWAQQKMNKNFLHNGKLNGKDIHESGIPQNFGDLDYLINNI